MLTGLGWFLVAQRPQAGVVRSPNKWLPVHRARMSSPLPTWGFRIFRNTFLNKRLSCLTKLTYNHRKQQSASRKSTNWSMLYHIKESTQGLADSGVHALCWDYCACVLFPNTNLYLCSLFVCLVFSLTLSFHAASLLSPVFFFSPTGNSSQTNEMGEIL